MSELNLEMSEKFDKDDAEFIRSELNQYLKVSEPSIMFRRSADPSLASFIELVGNVYAWQPISLVVKAYLYGLGFWGAHATWASLASILKRNEVKPLKDVAETLAKVADRIDGEVMYRFGLKIPHDDVSTEIWTEANNPEELKRVVASFVVNVEELFIAMKAEIDAGRTPLLRHAMAELQDDGSLLVKWQTKDSTHCELRIPRR